MCLPRKMLRPPNDLLDNRNLLHSWWQPTGGLIARAPQSRIPVNSTPHVSAICWLTACGLLAPKNRLPAGTELEERCLCTNPCLLSPLPVSVIMQELLEAP
jgi:hypothetical protein